MIPKQHIIWICSVLLFTGTSSIAGNTYVFGGTFDRPPYQFMDENGALRGTDVDAIRAVARAGGFELSVINIVNNDYTEVDGVLGNQSNLPGFVRALPHTSVDSAILVHRGSLIRSLDDARSREIAVVSGSAQETQLREYGFGNQLVLAKSPHNLAEALLNETAEVALADTRHLHQVLRGNSDADIRLISDAIESVPHSFSIRAGNSDLLDKVESGLSVMRRTGELERLYSAEQPPELRTADSLFSKVYAYAVWIILPLCLLVAAAVITARQRKETAHSDLETALDRIEDLRGRLDELHAENQRQKYVIKRLSAVSLVDQVCEASASDSSEPVVALPS